MGSSRIFIILACICLTALITGAAFGFGWWIGASSDPEVIKPSSSVKKVIGNSHYIEVTNENERNIKLYDKDGTPLLHIDAAVTLVEPNVEKLKYAECPYPNEKVLCVELYDSSDNKVRLTVSEFDDNCFEFWWFTDDLNELKDCVLMEGASSPTYWYGGAQMFEQRWPLNDASMPMQAYTTNDIYTNNYGSVQERYWVTSTGVALVLDEKIPLHVGTNENKNGKLCFASRYKDSIYSWWDKEIVDLKYKICTGTNVGYNIKSVHKMVMEKFYDKPIGIPDEGMFKHPVWSTWARYKKNVTQEVVLNFAQEIQDNDYPHSHIEIDDEWASAYGDWEFNSEKFPNPEAMVTELNNMGYRVTIWTHPFANIDSKTFIEGAEKRPSYWVRDTGRITTGLVKWWDGVGATVDTINEDALAWFVSNAEKFRDKYGLDSFKFDAGETNWLPASFSLNAPYPNMFSKKYCEACAQFGNLTEVRTATRTQSLPIFVRIMDKDSRWGYDNGLKTLIPCSLLFGLLGYPFVLPDMIGGNAYGPNVSLGAYDYPDEELFIRWMEANALLPSLQFSISPWQYDNPEVNTIAKKMIALHEEYTPLILELANNAVLTGEPIVRPLWWLASTDQQALISDSEFLLGDDVLVAPILEEGSTNRDIYLPQGTWLDQLRNEIHEGPILLENYNVALDELPYFTRHAGDSIN